MIPRRINPYTGRGYGPGEIYGYRMANSPDPNLDPQDTGNSVQWKLDYSLFFNETLLLHTVLIAGLISPASAKIYFQFSEVKERELQYLLFKYWRQCQSSRDGGISGGT